MTSGTWVFSLTSLRYVRDLMIEKRLRITTQEVREKTTRRNL